MLVWKSGSWIEPIGRRRERAADNKMKRRARNLRPVVQPRNYFKRLTKVGCDFHRMFFRWYQDNKHLFALELHIVSRSRSHIEFFFPGINNVILGTISAIEIEIHVIKDDEHFDIIAGFPCFVTRVPGGYIDELLLPEYQFTAPDKEMLCRIVSFEHFLRWVNDDLVNAKWIKIIVWPGRGSAAKLVKDDVPAPLWVADRHRVIETLEGGGYIIEKKDSEPKPGSEKTILWILPCPMSDPTTRPISSSK